MKKDVRHDGRTKRTRDLVPDPALDKSPTSVADAEELEPAAPPAAEPPAEPLEPGAGSRGEPSGEEPSSARGFPRPAVGGSSQADLCEVGDRPGVKRLIESPPPSNVTELVRVQRAAWLLPAGARAPQPVLYGRVVMLDAAGAATGAVIERGVGPAPAVIAAAGAPGGVCPSPDVDSPELVDAPDWLAAASAAALPSACSSSGVGAIGALLGGGASAGGASAGGASAGGASAGGASAGGASAGGASAGGASVGGGASSAPAAGTVSDAGACEPDGGSAGAAASVVGAGSWTDGPSSAGEPASGCTSPACAVVVVPATVSARAAGASDAAIMSTMTSPSAMLARVAAEVVGALTETFIRIATQRYGLSSSAASLPHTALYRRPAAGLLLRAGSAGSRRTPKRSVGCSS
jgi:hypothetical protein